ncbi:MAG: hypothetical protein IJU92_06905 [Spirochaetaceae bacterium]|nr:hypothetical protein [Spirochaetaceae bacterium]
MPSMKDRFEDDLKSISVGSPTLGLSDAIVGTYEHDYVRDDGGAGNTGGGSNDGGDSGGGGIIGEIGKVLIGWGVGKVIDKAIEIIKNPKPGCCCGGGTGCLINESEIIL